MGTNCKTSAQQKRWMLKFRVGQLHLRQKGDSQLQTKNVIGVVNCKMCLFSLYFVKCLRLRKSDFTGWWSATS